MASLGDVLVKFGADVGPFLKDTLEVDRKLKELSGQFDKIGTGLTNLGTGLTAGITVPLLGVGAASIAAFSGFEQSLAGIKSVSSLTGAEFEQLKEKAIQLGMDTKYSATEAANGMKELAAAGFNTNQIMAAAGPVLNLAAAGQMEVAAASELAANTLGQFNLKAEDTQHVADVLVTAANSAQTNVVDLGESMKYAGGLASTAGLDFNTTAAALAIMSESGLKGSMAGTSFAAAMREMLNPSTQQAAVMERLGVSFTDATGKLLPFDQIIQQVQEKVTNAQDRIVLFGTEGVRSINALANSKTSLVEFTQQLVNSDGAAKKAADTLNDTLTGRLEQFKGSIETAGIKIGQSLAPAIGVLLEKLLGLANTLVQAATWFGGLPQPVQTAALAVAGLAAAVGPLLLGLGTLASSFGSLVALPGQLSAGLTAIQSAAGAAGTALTGTLGVSLSTIGIALGVVVAAFAAWKLAEWAYDNFEPFKAAVDATWAAIKSLASLITDVLVVGFNAWWSVMTLAWDLLSAVLAPGITAFSAVIDYLGKSIKDNAVAALKMFTEAMQWVADKANALKLAFNDLIGKSNETAIASKNVGTAYKTMGKDGEDAMNSIIKAKKDATEESKKLKGESDKLTTSFAGLGKETKATKTDMEDYERAVKAAKEEKKRLQTEIQNNSTAWLALQSVAKSIATEHETLKQKVVALKAELLLGRDAVWAMNQAVTDGDLLFKNLSLSMTATSSDIKNLAVPAVAAMSTEFTDLSTDVSDCALDIDLKTKEMTGSFSGFTNSVSTSITNFAQDIASSLWSGDTSWGEKGKALLSSLGQAVSTSFIEPATQAISSFISGALANLLGGSGFGGVSTLLDGIGNKFKNIFSGGGASATPSIPSSPTGGIPGGSTGGAAGGLLGAIGSIGSVVGAVSGVIGNFQMSGMNKSLDVLVKHTLQLVMIGELTFYTFATWLGGIHNKLFDAKDVLDWINTNIADGFDVLHSRLIELRTFGIGVFPAAGMDPIPVMIAGGSAPVHIENINIYSDTADPLALGDALVDQLEKLGVRP